MQRAASNCVVGPACSLYSAILLNSFFFFNHKPIGDDLLDFLDKPCLHLNKMLFRPGSFGEVLWLALTLPKSGITVKLLSLCFLYLMSSVLLLLPEEFVVRCPTDGTQLCPTWAFAWISSRRKVSSVSNLPSTQAQNPHLLQTPNTKKTGLAFKISGP